METTKMDADEISLKLQAVLRPHLRFLDKDKPFPMEEQLGVLGLDSMAAINLLCDLEQSFGIQISDSMLTPDTFATAKNLENVVKSLLPNQTTS